MWYYLSINAVFVSNVSSPDNVLSKCSVFGFCFCVYTRDKQKNCLLSIERSNPKIKFWTKVEKQNIEKGKHVPKLVINELLLIACCYRNINISMRVNIFRFYILIPLKLWIFPQKCAETWSVCSNECQYIKYLYSTFFVLVFCGLLP